jgi:hypothetical protein
LLEEAYDAALPDDPLRSSCARIRWPESWLAADPALPTRMLEERDRAIASYRARRDAPPG